MATILFCVVLGLAGCGGGGSNRIEQQTFPPGLTGSIEGRVIAGTMTPVTDAMISVDRFELTVLTGEDGSFRIDGVPVGSYELEITHPRYRDSAYANVEVSVGQVTTIADCRLGIGYYLCVGAGKYPYLSSGNSLAGPVNDATGMHSVLAANFIGAGTLLTDEKATKAGIKSAIQAAGLRMAPEDFFVLTYSGHGLSFTLGDRKLDAIYPFDAVQGEFSTLISDVELCEWLSVLPNPRRCVVVLDACYAGSFSDGTPSTNASMLTIAPLSPMPALAQTGCTVLSASGSTELAYEREAHGIFTRYLEQGMSSAKVMADANRDRRVTAGELYQYAATKTTAEVATQHPRLQIGLDPLMARY